MGKTKSDYDYLIILASATFMVGKTSSLGSRIYACKHNYKCGLDNAAYLSAQPLGGVHGLPVCLDESSARMIPS